ncbi:MAG: hypothetical protein ABIY55_14130 [Kofleriaceae bacterium]
MNGMMDSCPDLKPFYTTLWIGSLILAVAPSSDPFGGDLEAMATRYFRLGKPAAKA